MSGEVHARDSGNDEEQGEDHSSQISQRAAKCRRILHDEFFGSDEHDKQEACGNHHVTRWRAGRRFAGSFSLIERWSCERSVNFRLVHPPVRSISVEDPEMKRDEDSSEQREVQIYHFRTKLTKSLMMQETSALW